MEDLTGIEAKGILGKGDYEYAVPFYVVKRPVDESRPVFIVRDNGIGIDPSQHDKVFELFYKVGRATEGTVVGLAIFMKIIEVHGGRIWIESELGKGCTICFTLPIA